MSLDLPHLLETAADEVASVSRAAAGSINELVHDWGHETRSFVSDHAPSLPSRRRKSGSPLLRLLLPIAILAVVAAVVMHRRRPHVSPHLPEREQPESHETTSTSSVAGKRLAEGAAAS